MALMDFIRRIFAGKQAGANGVRVSDILSEAAGEERAVYSLELERFAISTAVDLIASLLSKCEIRTFLHEKEVFGEEYYRLNFSPNPNQNGAAFWRNVMETLLREGKCLVVEAGGSLLVADSFGVEERACQEEWFTGVTSRGFSFDRAFAAHEVLYLESPNREAVSLLSSYRDACASLMGNAAARYRISSGQKGIVQMDAEARGNAEEEQQEQEMLMRNFKGFLEHANAVLPLRRGFQYLPLNSEKTQRAANEITDLITLADDIVDRVARAFRIPPALLRGETADLSGHLDNVLTWCAEPYALLLQNELNRKRYGRKILSGSYVLVDSTSLKKRDVFEQSERIDRLIASSAYTPNEIRRKLGDSPILEPWADRHVLTKNYALVSEPAREKEEFSS